MKNVWNRVANWVGRALWALVLGLISLCVALAFPILVMLMIFVVAMHT